MIRTLLWILLMIGQFLINPLSAAEVEAIDCSIKTGGSHTKTCHIYIAGVIQETDSLFMPYVADADRSYFKDSKDFIGSTGYLTAEHAFYAAWIPRMYDLSPWHGKKDPTIVVEIKSFLGDSVGIGHPDSVSIMGSESAMGAYIWNLAGRLGAFILFLVLITSGWGLLDRRHNESLYFSRFTRVIFYVSSTIFILSMSKLLRFSMPYLLDGGSYYYVHIIAEAFMIWALAALMLSCRPSGLRAQILRHKENFTYAGAGHFINTIILLFGVGALAFIEKGSLKGYHVQYVFYQSLIGFSLGLVSFVSNLDPRKRVGFLWNDWLFVGALMLCSGTLVRDAIYYLSHDAGTNYYIHYALCLSFFAFYLRSKVNLKRDQDVEAFTARGRDLVLSPVTPQERLKHLAEACATWHPNIARVTITENHNDYDRILASAGSEALELDATPKKAGVLSQVLNQNHKTQFSLSPSNDGSNYVDLGLGRAFIALPFIEGGHMVGALMVMGREGKVLSFSLVESLTRILSSLSNQVALCIQDRQVRETNEKLTSLVRVTSGIILEYKDSFGELSLDSIATERIIITADLVGTTRVSEKARSTVIAEAFSRCKEAIFTHWLSLSYQFEFISKDVRGDDFWVLNPKAFTKGILSELGPERVGIILAVELERVAREIVSNTHYKGLGIPGAHVAMTKDALKVVTYGPPGARVVDTNSNRMPFLSRIRSLAMPPGVIVDGFFPELAQVAQSKDMESNLYSIKEEDMALLKDLYHLPELRKVYDYKDLPEIRELVETAKEDAESQLTDGPFRYHKKRVS